MVQLPMHELELLKQWTNHAEFKRKLRDLGLVSDIHLLDGYVREVAVSWFELGRAHLTEASQSLGIGLTRSIYSRAYYASYSMSKSIRFVYTGFVSLKGDDHRAVGNLPSDFPNFSSWGADLELLYQHRLYADYDNWSDTQSKYTITPVEAVSKSAAFEADAAIYLNSKYGFSL